MSIQTEEHKAAELKEEAPQSKDRSHGKALKIGCAAGGFVAVVALCILSSRFSWFGVQADNDGINNNTTPSYSSDVPTESEKAPTKANKPDTVSETTAATTPAVTTTAVTTTTTPKATTTTTTTTTKATSKTTPATTAAPKPAWTEEKCSGTMYINVLSCSARKQGLQGSEVVSYKYYGDAVNVTALTDTGYYKLEDGSYVHSDYLSKTKPAETTAATTTTTAKPKTDNTVPASSGITDQPVNCSAEEAEVFRIVNEIRVSYGLTPYKWDANAYKAAKARCSEIEQVFSHTRPDGSNFKTIYGYSEDEVWYKFSYVGENLGSGQSTAQKVVDRWMASTRGHRENILNPNFENMAVAFDLYNDAYKYYWVQEFTTYR